MEDENNDSVTSRDLAPSQTVKLYHAIPPGAWPTLWTAPMDILLSLYDLLQLIQ